MSRRRKSKAKKKPQLEPEDILEGRAEPRVEDLFDLIHRVNPTLRHLPKKEETRRYALKNRLQSLLIRGFGDEHLKVEPAAHGGVVSLEHISGVRDACHAVIAELEPDARAWVQRRLDLAARGEAPEDRPAPAAGEPAAGDEIDDLLWRGRRALEEYDYEAGEEHLRQALASSHGAAESQHAAAAQALLELQVGVLGLDTAALEVEPQLSEAAKKQPAIRTLLALAAARLGDAGHALELVAGLTAAVAGVSLPRAAEVYAALTANAVHGRDRPAAQRYLEQVAELDPTHPGIPRLESEIAGLRAEDQRSAEAELERRFRERGAAAVEEEARALADRWPEGEVARRILRQAAAERRSAEISEHLELADRARVEDRLEDAVEHYQAALDAGAERPGLASVVAELAERGRRRRERAAVDGAARRLAESPAAEEARRDALLAYLALAEELKARVRERLEQPALGWLEEIGAADAGSRARAAAAVAALEHAIAALEDGRPQDAIDLLEPHRGILRKVARARSLWRQARRRTLEERRRRAAGELDAAQAALEAGRPEAARRHLDAVALGDLAGADRSRRQDLQARLDAASELERLEREHRELLAAGDLTGALARARRLVAGTREHAADLHRAWRSRFAELQQRLRAAWKLEVVAGDRPASQALMPARFLEGSLAWLDDDGRELVLVNALDRWLFIDAVDVPSARVTDRVSLHIPAPLEHPLVVFRDGDRLWIAGRDGDAFEIDRASWDLLGYYPVAELVSGERTVERVRPLPGSDRLWVRVTGAWGEEEICLVDLHRWRLERRFPFGSARWIPLLSGSEPRMLLGTRLAARLFSAGGEQIGPDPLLRENVSAADLGPDGRGLLLLASARVVPRVDEDDYGFDQKPDEESLALVRLAQTRAAADSTPARLELPQAHPHYGFHGVVTSPAAGLSYVLFYTKKHDQELWTFSPESVADLEPVSRSRWSGRATLILDRHARHVAAATLDGAAGVELRFLGPSPAAGTPSTASLDPPSEDARGARRSEMPSYKHYSTCGKPAGDFGASVDELAQELEGRGIGPLRSRLARTESSTDATIDDQLRIVLALQQQRTRQYKLEDAIEGFAHRIARKHPRHAGAVLVQADLLAKAEEWDRVSAILRRAAPPANLDSGRARHFHHLEGLAHLHGGRLKKSYAAFRRALAHEGTCALEPMIYLTQPMSDPPDADEWAPGEPAVRRLLGAIRTADRALADGDPAAARAALDRRDVRFHNELQIAARRASLYLDLPAATAADRFDQRVALAYYAHLRKLETFMRHNLFLPGLQWDDERLQELEERVFARLEELGGD